MTVLLLIIGLILFVGLVVVHELGHFITARRNGVEAEEFGIGFPPRARALGKWKGTVFTLNWLPLGGFVKLKGEHDTDTTKGSYGAASLWVKTKIMLAGVAMNLATAFVLLTLLALTGIPTLISKDTQGEDQFTVKSNEHAVTRQVLINKVESGSPAEKAGLKTLDRVESIGSEHDPQQNISGLTDLQQKTKALAGQKVVLRYERDSKQQMANMQLRSASEVEASRDTDHPKGFIGIGLSNYEVNRYTWAAPVVAVGLMKQITVLTLKGLGTALKGLGGLIAGLLTGNTPARQAAQAAATEQVSGPVGIFFVLQAGAHEGLGMVVFIVALISLTLAIMNVLPIPALDGGRLFVTLVSRMIRRPLSQGAEELIHGAGFMVLMFLFVLITIVDVRRFF